MTKFKKGDLIYFEGKCEKCYGIVTEIKGEKVWAYWQRALGDKYVKEFQTYTQYMPIKDCILEPDWSKIKGFKNIPKIANYGYTVSTLKKKPRKWTVDTTVKSDDGIVVSKDEIHVPTLDLAVALSLENAKNVYKQLGASLKIHKRYFNN